MTLSGASRDYINLLPDPAGDDSWTTFLPTVEDIGDDAIFAFDGETTAVEIPRSALDPDLLSTAARFTISTWMKRDQRQAEEHDKQQIVCAADGEGSTQAAAYTSSSQLTLSSRTKQGCSISLQSGRILRGPHVVRQQQLSVNICCRRRPQQQTRGSPLLLTIDGTDRLTDGHSTVLTLTAYWADRVKFDKAISCAAS